MASSVVRDEITILQLCNNDGSLDPAPGLAPALAHLQAWLPHVGPDHHHYHRHSHYHLNCDHHYNFYLLQTHQSEIYIYVVSIINSDENCQILPPLNSQTRPTHP